MKRKTKLSKEHATKTEQKKESDKTKLNNSSNTENVLNRFLWILFAFIFGYFHITHIETLFENDKHFSHLSNLERELSFRTESGLYYYYFKLLAVDKNLNPINDSLISLTVNRIINDKRTEYPLTINSIQRFNLYPEIVLGILYRIANSFNLLKRKCWQVNRGDGMPPVDSCEGYLEPIYFYSESVFILHGFSMAILFTLCYLLNKKSIFSGVIGCLCYLYNHSEATRVMWTPALRESFSFPFHLFQLVMLTNFLIYKKVTRSTQIWLIISTLVYLLPWQFAQFSLGTQTASIFATYSLGFINRDKLLLFIKSQSIALIICFILMFANRMLMTSFFASLLCSIWLIILFENLFRVENDLNRYVLWKKILFTLGRVIFLLLLTFSFKKFILQSAFQQEDDSHIWDILKSKFNDKLQTFDTRLYTCAKEFDFISKETFFNLSYTLLLPLAILSFIYYSIRILIKYFFTNYDKNENDDHYDEDEDESDGDYDELNEYSLIVYNVFQLISFSLMAFLIMRLKLFWTPHLCVFASFLATKSSLSIFNFFLKFFPNKSDAKISNASDNSYFNNNKTIILILIIGLMSYNGLTNIQQQHKIIGEYNDYAMESLMNWINKNTRLNDTFAGGMPVMANVKLSTDRPIVIHPHYEDVGLRDRVRKIYTYLYGFRPVEDIHSILKNEFKAKYLVLESHVCFSHPPGKPYCALSEISHLSLEKTSHKQACASILEQDDNTKKYFLKKFNHKHVNVFRIL